MKIDDSDLTLKDLLNQATVQKGQLDQTDLYVYGKKLVSTRKKIILFFKETGNTIRYGRKEALQKKTSYFSTKSIKLITKLNQILIIERVTDLSGEEFKKYLSLLKEGEILTQNSHHWGKINAFHQSYVYLQEVKDNPKIHWLQPFATGEDLGLNFENIDPFKEQGPIHQLIKLDQLRQEARIPDFVPLLQFILGDTKIKDVTNEQIRELVDCLNTYSGLPVEVGADRIEETKQLFQLLNRMEKSKGPEKKNKFKLFLKDNPTIRKLLTHLSTDYSNPGTVDQLLNLKKLVPQLPSLPIDLPFCRTLEEVIQKMEYKLQTQKSALTAERFGKFAESFNALTDHDDTTLGLLEGLKLIEEEFSLCGKQPLFIKLLDQATGAGFHNKKELLEKVKKFPLQEPLLLHTVLRVGEKTKEFIHLGVNPDKIRAFQDMTFAAIEPTTTDVKTRLQGKEGIEKRVKQFAVNFNKEQLAEAKIQWSSYGPQIAEHFTRAIDPEVENGEKHYKHLASNLPDLAEIERLFVEYDAKQLESEFGLTLTSHVMDYLLSPAGKELRVQPDFIKKTLPQQLEKLRAVKAKFIEQGIAPEAFDKDLNRFLTTSAYARSQENWWILDSAALTTFFRSIQYKINENELDGLMKTQGKVFADCLMKYLKENEAEVLTGDVALKDSQVFQTTPFSEQVRLYILPYLIPNLKPTAVLDKDIITSSLLKEPLSPENFQNRLNNISRLQSLLPKAANDRDKLQVKEFIRHLNPPYLIDLNINYNALDITSEQKEQISKAESQAREAVQKLLKFCRKEGDEEGVYSPDLIARAVLELINQQGKPQDLPAAKLQAASEACDAIFNGDIIKKFKASCLKLYMEDVAKKTCEEQFKPYSEDIDKLTQSLMARFADPSVGLKSAHAAAYVQDLVQFSVNLCLTYSVPYYLVSQALTAQMKSHHFTFDLNALNKLAKNKGASLSLPADIKDQLTDEIKATAGPQSFSKGIIGVIKVNPFSIVNAFVPRLLGNLLPDEDKAQVAEVQKALIPLGPLFNQSATVGKGLNLLTKLLEFVSTTHIDQPAKDFAIEQIKGFNALDLDQIGNLKDRHLYRQAFGDKGLGIWITITETLSDRLMDIHAKMHAAEQPKFHEILTDKTGATDQPKPSDPLVDFIGTDLPNLAEDLDTVKAWINRLPKIIPVIRKVGGGWIANKILKRYVTTRLEKVEFLDNEAKKLLSESLESVIKIALLATPTMIQNHNIDVYFEFIKKLNDTMQQKERPDADVLLIDVMKIVQQATREMMQYAPVLEDAIDHVEESLIKQK